MLYIIISPNTVQFPADIQIVPKMSFLVGFSKLGFNTGQYISPIFYVPIVS
jgi:hypothetical protein